MQVDKRLPSHLSAVSSRTASYLISTKMFSLQMCGGVLCMVKYGITETVLFLFTLCCRCMRFSEVAKGVVVVRRLTLWDSYSHENARSYLESGGTSVRERLETCRPLVLYPSCCFSFYLLFLLLKFDATKNKRALNWHTFAN